MAIPVRDPISELHLRPEPEMPGSGLAQTRVRKMQKITIRVLNYHPSRAVLDQITLSIGELKLCQAESDISEWLIFPPGLSFRDCDAREGRLSSIVMG